MIFPTEVILKAINLSVLKKKMAFSTPPSSSSSFLIQYQRDYDSIHHNKGNGAKKQSLKGKVVVLLTHCSPRRLPRSDEFGPFGSHVEHISQPHLRRTCVATVQELCHELH